MHTRIGENKPWDEAELRKTLDDLLDGLRDLNLTMVRNTVSLEQHERRTAIAEERLEKIQAELQPLKTFVAAWGGAATGVGVLGTLVGILAGILHFMGKF